MKYRILFVELLILILILDSCETKQALPNREQITEIITETIKQDSLDINIPICLNLVNRYIYQQEYNKESGYLPPPPRNKNGEPFVFKFYKSTKDNSNGLNQKDSIFVANQVESNKDIAIEVKTIPKYIKIKNVPVLKNNEMRLYKFLIPLFNSTNDFAMVEYDFQCAGCGYGTIVFFRKIGGKWIKVESLRTWMN